MQSVSTVEAQLRAVLDSVSDCYYALDRDWKFVEFNRASEEYFSLKRGDVLGRCLWDLFPAGKGRPYEDLCRTAMDRGQHGRMEAPSAFRKGNTVEMRVAPMDGGISVALTDITDRLHTRARLEAAVAERTAALQASESRVRAMVETSHLFQGLMELDGALVDCNAASLAAIKARTLYKGVDLRPDQPLSEAIVAAIESSTIHIDHPLDHRDLLLKTLTKIMSPMLANYVMNKNELVYYDQDHTPIFDADGRLVGSKPASGYRKRRLPNLDQQDPARLHPDSFGCRELTGRATGDAGPACHPGYRPD